MADAEGAVEGTAAVVPSVQQQGGEEVELPQPTAAAAADADAGEGSAGGGPAGAVEAGGEGGGGGSGGDGGDADAGKKAVLKDRTKALEREVTGVGGGFDWFGGAIDCDVCATPPQTGTVRM